MELMIKDPVYLTVVGLARAVFFAQGLKFTITGMENIPKDTGAVVVTNHTGYMDFTYVGLPFRKYRRYVRFMAKKEVFDHPIGGPIMRSLKHIPVDRTDGSKAFDHAVRLLKEDELVGVFPESTISRSFEVKNLKPGAVRMAKETGKPILPVLIVGSQRVWTKGHPKHLGRSNTPIHLKVLPAWYPEGDDLEATEQLHDIMDQGVRELWDEYIAKEGPIPPGAYWAPARLGGGAPTFEQAQSEDLKVEKERKRIRHLRKDLVAFTEKLRESGRELSASARELGDQTRASILETTQTVSEESARARLQAKEQATAILAQFRQSVEQLADEVTVGAKEGAESVRAASESVREALKDTYAHLEEASNAGLESSQQSAFKLIAQSKLIRDRLPQRTARLIQNKPQAIVIDATSALLDGEGAISAAMLEQLSVWQDAGVKLFVADVEGSELNLAELAPGVQVTPIVFDEQASRQSVTNVVSRALNSAAADAQATILISGNPQFAEAMMFVGLPAVVVDGDWALIRTADWVIDSAVNDGPAQTLAALQDRFIEEAANSNDAGAGASANEEAQE